MIACMLTDGERVEVFTGPLGSENPRPDPRPERARVQNFYECLGHGSGSVLGSLGSRVITIMCFSQMDPIRPEFF